MSTIRQVIGALGLLALLIWIGLGSPLGPLDRWGKK